MRRDQEQVIDWMAKGEHGGSSLTMALWLGFAADYENGNHPYDPADFDRCLRLLDRAPLLRKQLPKMASVSPAWKALVDRWDEIEKCHLDEVGLGWTKARSAPKTYKLMKQVLGDYS